MSAVVRRAVAGPGQPGCRSYLPMPWDTESDPPLRWKRQTGYQKKGTD